MIKIIDTVFISTKEASRRYGLSSRWFIKRREMRCPKSPKYIKVGGKVLYPLDDTDKWFKSHYQI